MATYTQEPYFEEANGWPGYDNSSSQQLGASFSPAMGSQDYAALLDSFTHTNTTNEQDATGPFAQSSYTSSYTPDHADNGQNSQQQVSYVQAQPLHHNGGEYSPTSTSQFSYSQAPSQSSMGLGIKAGHHQPQQLQPQHDQLQLQQQNQHQTHYSVEQPDHHTVPYLEAMAQAPQAANQGQYQYQYQAPLLSRNESSRSLLDGPHLAALSLNSPRNSLSAPSSAPSSAQTSPTTPMSAYSYESNGPLQMQQQYSQQSQSDYNNYQQYAIYSSPYNGQQDNASCNPLSVSMPASLSSQGMQSKSHNTGTLSSHGRLSSAGLMDAIVNSRKVAVSPSPIEPETVENAAKEVRKSRSRANSKTKKSPTPPTTPGRSNLRMSIGAGELAGGLETIPSGHSTPTSDAGQTLSSVGPHRTPSKRMHIQDGNVQQSVPVLSATPKRPGGLRRTMSHTPASGNDAASQSGLASPADLAGASVRAQHAAQSAIASAVQPAQKARIADSSELEFPGNSSGMSRARSSPGIQLSTSLSRQGLTLDAALSPNALQRSRRGTVPGLQMSPLNATFNGRASASSSPSRPVSFAEALLAIDQISAFLNYQASLISSDSRQTAATVLGNYEQMQAIEDIRRRIQCQLSGPI